MDRPGQAQLATRLEREVAVDRGRGQPAQPAEAVGRGGVRDRQQAQPRRLGREDHPGQGEPDALQDHRVDQGQNHGARLGRGPDHGDRGEHRDREAEHRHQVEQEPDAEPDDPVERPALELRNQAPATRPQRHRDPDVGQDREPHVGRHAQADVQPERALVRIPGLGAQPIDQERDLIEGVQDRERHPLDHVGARRDLAQKARDHVVRQDRVARGMRLRLRGFEGAQGGDQLIAPGRVLEGVDQALQPLAAELRRRRGRLRRDEPLRRPGPGGRGRSLRQGDRGDRQQRRERRRRPPGTRAYRSPPPIRFGCWPM